MNNKDKSIIVIGGGMAGLASGIYGQFNGFKTTVFEMNRTAGGFVTSWKRKGYTFDAAMDWFIGTDPHDRSSIVWRELGYLQGKKINYYDDLVSVKDTNGNIWTLYTDPEKLENELIHLTDFDEDKKQIKKLCKDIAKLIKAPSFDFRHPQYQLTGKQQLKMMTEYMSCIGLMIKYNKELVTDYADAFKDPRLRDVMTYMFYEPESPHVPFVFVFQLAAMFKKTAGYPEGGSSAVSKTLVRRYKDLGGNLKTRSKVKKILVHNNKSVGVQLEDGSEHFADYVISACDTRTVIYKMLDGQYVDDNITKLYKKGPIHASVLKVYLGVDKDFSWERDVIVHLLKEPLDIKGLFQKRPRTSLVLRHYCNYDASFAPPGKSVLESFFYSEYDYWKNLRSTDMTAYKNEKKRVADIVIDRIEKIYPGTKEKIEVVDVVTPVTYHRYTGNYKGSVMGWFDDTTIAQDLIKKIGFTLPGLKNFFMTGQWIVTGGMVRAAGSGRYAIEQICKSEKEKFLVPAV